MECMVVMVLPDDLPILVLSLPVCTILLLLDALAVTVPVNALVRTPSPLWLLVVVVVLPHLPELASDTPSSLHIVLDNSVPIAVVTTALVRAPGLPRAAVECMVVVSKSRRLGRPSRSWS